MLIFLLAAPASARDVRKKIDFPPTLREHMLANMRDHLVTLADIQAAIGRDDLAEAGAIAERRLGMSSLAAHGAAHVAPFMPQAMQQLGTSMHRSASHFARVAQEGDGLRAMESLARVTRSCTACHAAYRVQ